MLTSYLKTAFRNLLRNREHFFVNMTGLVVGFSAFLLIFVVLAYVQSYDGFHTRKDRIFRLTRESKSTAAKEYGAGIPFPMANALRTGYSQIETTAGIHSEPDVQVIIPESNAVTGKKFREAKGVFFAEPQFFQIFDFKMLEGNASNALKEPNTALLTRDFAIRYFGDWKTAAGKTIKVMDQNVTVTGILENPPANTDFPLGVVVSLSTFPSMGIDMNNWVGISDDHYCFLLLKPGITKEQIESQLPDFISAHVPPSYAGYFLKLQPLNEMHFDKRFGNYNNRTFSKDLIATLRMIGIFLLIIACVNFINLTTANAINRSKEVGVRKVLGSSRQQLLLQFFGEAGITCLLAMTAALIVSLISISFLNNLLDLQMSWSTLLNFRFFMFVLLALIIVTILSGFYPALILSGFNPMNALKSVVKSETTGGMTLRRGLVILQFAIAQVLIIGTLVIISQMSYFNNADMGFNKHAVVTARFPRDSASQSKIDVIRNLLQREKGIKDVSFSMYAPTGNGGWATDLRLSTNHTDKIDLIVNMKPADTAYFRVYNFHLLAGRVYFSSDTAQEFVVNETLLKKLELGSPEEAIGKRINVMHKLCPIVGVVKDFHTKSLREPISPIIMTNGKSNYGLANIKIAPDRLKESISTIESVWNEIYPDYVFSYSFIDQTIADYYKQETQLALLFRIFAGIAILISCLGVYGLVSFMVVRRRKEIGIRKILGAPVGNIVILLTKEFTMLIIIAFSIAAPLAWWFMQEWLQQYSFRINLGIGFFITTLMLSVLIAWLTVGHSTIKAAFANPLRNLRSE